MPTHEEVKLTRQAERIKELEAELKIADEQMQKLEALLDPNVKWEDAHWQTRAEAAEKLLAEAVKVLEQIAAPAIFFLSKKDALFMRNAARDFLATLKEKQDADA